MIDILVISPHMDDAALSLGQHILEWKKQGKKVKVVTVFTKFGDGKNLPDYSVNYLTKSGFKNVADFEKVRIKEDTEAMKMMGVEWEHWGMVDAGFRGNHQTREELLGGVIKSEDDILLEILRKKVRNCQAEIIYLPFGVGGHADHLIVRKAGEGSGKKLAYYFESPYLWQRLNFIKYLKFIKKIKFPQREKDGFLKCYKSQYLLLKQNVWWPLSEIVYNQRYIEIKYVVLNFLDRILKKILTRGSMYKYNRYLFELSVHGMGMMNYETSVDEGELLLLKKIGGYFARSKPVVFDVGANKGMYSLQVYKYMVNSVIYSFEPNPKVYSILKTNADNKYLPIRLALGEKKSIVKLFDIKGFGGTEAATFYKDVITESHGYEVEESNVKVDTLDNFVLRHKIKHINLLKIDVEGGELGVLKGAIDLIKSNSIDIIHFEFNEMNVYSRVLFKDFYDMLSNYKLYRMLPDSLAEMGEYWPLTCEIFAYQNIVAVNLKCPFKY